MNVRTLVISGVVTVGAAGASVAVAHTSAFDDHTERDPSGTIVSGGGLGAFAVQIGDCVLLPETLAEPPADKTGDPTMTGIVESVEGVPCDQPHDAQAYATFDVGGVGTYDEALITDRAHRSCVARWRAAVGTSDVTDPVSDVWFLMPTEQSWSLLGDRLVTCFVVPINGSPLVGSVLVEG